MRKFLLLLVGVLWLWAPTAGAADGDICDSGNGVQNRSGYSTKCVLVCDGKTTGSTTCDDVDLRDHGNPEYIILRLESVTGCSAAYSVDVDSQSSATGTEYDVTTLDSGTRRAFIYKDAMVGRFLDFDLTNPDDCDLDVEMEMRFREGS